MLELKCIDCYNHKHRPKIYVSELLDKQGKKYIFELYDFIPCQTTIRINPFYHIFYKNENSTNIAVKQKFERENQPEYLELEVIKILETEEAKIITYKDTNTQEEYKRKYSVYDKDIGFVECFNLKELDLVITSMPCFFKSYRIENWLYKDNVVETI